MPKPVAPVLRPLESHSHSAFIESEVTKSSIMSTNKIRTYVLTGSVAAITATGAWYGAGLKTRQEFKQEQQTIREYPITEKIESLEATKRKLLQQRAELQGKIDKLTSKTTNVDEQATAKTSLPRGR
ncbi:hypothetical protein DOTSEDRAFT_18949 [Lecanosticta acicola]|uniref:Uncharacterized protein n=1 Tax=Lecanosticta acicola TaxID=111012 RepID=A0AAI8YUV1_9PEZI|nr:hypothetical protein DOTSEDRAFT_18949 [Lecanosticta acicola]